MKKVSQSDYLNPNFKVIIISSGKLSESAVQFIQQNGKRFTKLIIFSPKTEKPTNMVDKYPDIVHSET